MLPCRFPENADPSALRLPMKCTGDWNTDTAWGGTHTTGAGAHALERGREVGQLDWVLLSTLPTLNAEVRHATESPFAETAKNTGNARGLQSSSFLTSMYTCTQTPSGSPLRNPPAKGVSPPVSASAHSGPSVLHVHDQNRELKLARSRIQTSFRKHA